MSNIKRLLELHKLAPSKYMFKAECYSEIAPAADFYNAVYEELPKLCADLEAANKRIHDLLMKTQRPYRTREFAVLNKMIELMAQEGIDLHQCTGFDSSNGVETYETDEQVIARFREDAEVVLQSRAEAEKGV